MSRDHRGEQEGLPRQPLEQDLGLRDRQCEKNREDLGSKMMENTRKNVNLVGGRTIHTSSMLPSAKMF